MGTTIGSSALYSTWAAIRSPMWKGSGYRYIPEVKNQNKGKITQIPFSIGFSMVYVEHLGIFSVASSFRAITVAGTNTYWANSMCLGVNAVGVQQGNDEEGIPSIFDFYLTHGQGILSPYNEDSYYEQVINGYTYPPTVNSGAAGYDIPRTRDQYRGAVVNVTFTPGPTLPPVTENVTITDELFPDNLNWSVFSPDKGIYLGTYIWPVPAEGLIWDQPYWTINSLTMPS